MALNGPVLSKCRYKPDCMNRASTFLVLSLDEGGGRLPVCSSCHEENANALKQILDTVLSRRFAGEQK